MLYRTKIFLTWKSGYLEKKIGVNLVRFGLIFDLSNITSFERLLKNVFSEWFVKKSVNLKNEIWPGFTVVSVCIVVSIGARGDP